MVKREIYFYFSIILEINTYWKFKLEFWKFISWNFWNLYWYLVCPEIIGKFPTAENKRPDMHLIILLTLTVDLLFTYRYGPLKTTAGHGSPPHKRGLGHTPPRWSTSGVGTYLIGSFLQMTKKSTALIWLRCNLLQWAYRTIHWLTLI